jgi:hypothetical protein
LLLGNLGCKQTTSGLVHKDSTLMGKLKRSTSVKYPGCKCGSYRSERAVLIWCVIVDLGLSRRCIVARQG